MNQEYGFVILFILSLVIISYLIDRNQKLNYKLNGRLSGSHSLQNLLVSGLYLTDQESRIAYLKAITELVQYSFTSQDKLLVNWDAEVEKIKLLVELFKIKNRIQINISIKENNFRETELNGLKIPPFILITLIENALIYGQIKNGDTIHIEIQKMELKMYLVKLNGFVLPKSRQLSHPSPGHGIDFVKRRITFLHEHFHTEQPENKQLFLDHADHSICLILPLLKSS
jgi:LytS/YehU family sensor histidine kinase